MTVVTFTNHFSGPDAAVGRVCVCVYLDINLSLMTDLDIWHARPVQF